MSGLQVRHPLLWIVALLFTAIAVVVIIATQLSCGGDNDDRPPYPFPVQTFEDQGREHLAAGQTYDGYNSSPPTSGPHAPRAAPWGVSDAPLPKEVPVHNMEHGGVVIWYNCSGGSQPLDEAGCRQLRDRLAAIVVKAVEQGKEVLMAPYADMKQRIALTAWRTLDAFDEFVEARVRAFIDSFERRFNPEHF